MQIIRPLQVGALQRVLEQDRRFYLTVSGSLGISLETGEALYDFDYLEAMLGAFGDDIPMLDVGMPKANGEFLATGAFFAPGGQAQPRGEVAVRVGQTAKILNVFGEREWGGAENPKLSPVAHCRINYANAFGGAGYERNPDGVGFKDGKLPRVESLTEPVRSKRDQPEPASLDVLDLRLPQRARFQGTFDNDYLAKYFPGLPADFDWAFHNCGAEDQWIKGYWQGDEPYEIRNMHPQHAVIKGKLPGLYCRAFLDHRIGGQEAGFSELAMNLDTVWFFPEQMLALTIWRGVIEVGDDEADDVDHILVACENRKDPARSAAHYQAALDLRLNNKDPLLNHFKTEDLIPLGAICAMEGLPQKALADYQPSALAQNVEAKTEAIKKEVDEKVEQALKAAEENIKSSGEAGKAAGVDPRKMLEDMKNAPPNPETEALKAKLEAIIPGSTGADPAKIQLKDFSFDKIGQMIAVMEDMAEAKKQEMFVELGKQREQIQLQIDMAGSQQAELVEQLQTLMQQIDDLISGKPAQGVLPRIRADELDAMVEPSILEARQHLEGMKALDVDSEDVRKLTELVEQGMEQARQSLRDGQTLFEEQYRTFAHFMPEGLSPHKEPEAKLNARLQRQILAREHLAGADLACLDLAGLNLDGMDLSRAYLEQADLSGASLVGTNLSGAVLARARMDGANFTNANLEQANIGGVKASGVNFSGANLRQARLGRSQYDHVNFSDCDLSGADFLEISLVACDFSRAILPERAFIETRLDGSVFRGADMNTALFATCSCEGSDFSEANLSPSVWADTNLDGVRFDGANMTQATFVSAELPVTMKRASFKGATLDKACFREMNLAGADFSSASMENTYFGSADLSGANLSEGRARFAQFRKAKLTRAICCGLNLSEGSISKAHLVEADFTGANLYGVDVLRATFGKTRFERANLDRTLIQDWKPS